MLYNSFKGERLSKLGFGAMRLPLTADGAGIDREQTEQMVRYAMENGVSYFDTAYPYHGGQSERVMGDILRHYPRASFNLASKYPGHQISESYDPAATFEEQLEKCHVDYFDYYLLHNVYENSISTYNDPRWGIVEYFAEQKRLGRIRRLGFSSHGGLDILHGFLDEYGELMEFCQIQLNYLDWTLQHAAEKYRMLTERGLGVWVMEPVRGGMLASLRLEDEAALRALRADESPAAWALRFTQGLDNVKMVLSGMSNLKQMKENVDTFSTDRPLNERETAALMAVAEGMKSSVPCTSCRYCCDGCPQGLNIPMLLGVYNELRVSPALNAAIRVEALPADKRPDACIACGACTQICPQKIDIPDAMRDLSELLEKMPKWAEICREREKSARKDKA